MKKRMFFVVIIFVMLGTAFAQVSGEIAVPFIQSEGIIAECNDEALTWEEFSTALEKAFPGESVSFESSAEPVLRKDFIVSLVDFLGLSAETETFEDAYTWSNDEYEIPEDCLGYFTLGYQSNHQLLDHRYGYLAAPFEPVTKLEAARAIYSAKFPPQQGGQVVTAVTADPPGFNTVFTSSGLTWTLCNIMGDGYLGTEENGFYIPRMIKQIPTVENGLIKMLDNGGMTVTYQLRKGIKWHDGVEVTANDAKFQWEVMTSDAPVTSNYFENLVSKVEVHDDYSFTIYFDQLMADAKFGSSVYAYYFGWFQLPEHVYRADFEKAKETGQWEEFSTEVTRNPILCGPYKFKEYKEGQYVVFEAFDDYYMGRPNIDTVVFRIIPDADSVFASTLNGEIDVGRYTLDLKQSLQLRDQKSDIYNVFLTPNVAYQCVDLNFRDPEDTSKPNELFADKRVRQAFLLGLNRDQINMIVYKNEAQIVDTWITELHMMREALKDPRVVHYPYNPAKARQLMEEAGWQMNKAGYFEKDGKVFEFDLIGAAGSTSTELLTQLIQGMLKGIGMKVNIDLKPSLVLWTEIMPTGKFDALLTGWGYGISDEAANYWGTNCIPSEANGFGGTNYTGWSNDENDAILEELTQTLEADKKLTLYEDHFALWTDELPTIPLMADPTPHFAKKYIQSFSSTYDGGLGWTIQNWYIQK
ncbi:MAG TPA: peptide ABC transporter substrate-binding protein [Thermotogota bacterium]|nr:peptide ABC transporter substrate-binding protein [Thermotogota bacterium]HPR95015.1 peptide ABC transporter substrate-binding protein [Thermotogota bacterium]